MVTQTPEARPLFRPSATSASTRSEPHRKDSASIERAVGEAVIRYPVVLDNNSATWDAYDNRYWPARYLIDADGFIRYRHYGEGAYEENEEEIQELLSEGDGISS